MSGKITGGPAFPVEQHDKDGMTLRDYFAAKAMQGLLAGATTSDGAMIVRDAYKIADAMMKAREA
jgi:hypothetical protein